jgi:hypothetical protein
MSDRFTEVTSTSWFTRIKNSLSGILIGILLFIAAFPLLFWNEGNAVKTANSLTEGANAVISLEESKFNPENNQKLIHLQGEIKVQGTLSDPEFVVETPAVKLIRKTEIYQWQEKSESKSTTKLGGREETTTTYTYVKDWSDKPIDSAQFKEQNGHMNPSDAGFEKKEFTVDAANIGDFELSQSLINKVPGREKLNLTEIPEELKQKFGDKIHLQNGGFYLGNVPSLPQIGDQRISFEIVKPGPVSIIAKQDNQKLSPYKTSNGKEIEMISKDRVSASEMFDAAQSANAIQTWILRFVGFLMMFIGLKMIFRVLSVIGSVIPFLGDLISLGTGLVAGLLAFVCSLVVIAIAWIFARPLLGISLLVIAIAAIVWLFHYKKTHPTPKVSSN